MEALRFNNLVYIPTPKHASQSYKSLFANQLGWKNIESETIDWDSDHVFSHIIHPYSRHIKGTAQLLFQNNLGHLIDHFDFQKIFATAFFDHHSYPLVTMFGTEKAYQIDWIPLDNFLIDGDTMTKSLLRSVGIDNVDIPKINQANYSVKNLVTRLSKIHSTFNVENSLIYMYDDDLILYSKINENLRFHEVNNMPWSECSWLTNYSSARVTTK